MYIMYKKRRIAKKANLQQMVKKRILAVSMLAVAFLTVLGVGSYINRINAEAAGGDCSDNSIIRCGIGNYNDLTAKYDQNATGDIRAIMDHYWIKRTPEAGNRVLEGIANNRGEVIADNRVVARNAASIGRTAIMHSRSIQIAGRTYYETTHVDGKAFRAGTFQLPALVILDSKGNFKYAILKGCGNPIYAVPVPPPTPPTPPKPPVTPPTPPVTPPAPKEFARCESLKVNILDRTKFEFIVSYKVENTKLQSVTLVIEDSNGKTTEKVINAKDIDAESLKKNQVKYIYTQEQVGKYKVSASIKPTTEKFDNCKKDFVVAEEDKEVVCEISTKNLNKVITKKEYEEDQKLEVGKRKYSKNQSDCEEKPVEKKENCEVPGKEHLPKDSPDCKEETPELPKTGGMTIAGALIGVTAITVAAYYYLNSRKGA